MLIGRIRPIVEIVAAPDAHRRNSGRSGRARVTAPTHREHHYSVYPYPSTPLTMTEEPPS
jgi:hypothetical protein